jgi:hypothetical protein
VTSIAYGTFAGCSGLTSIVIPAGVTSIGGYAFAGCSGLTSIVIPAGVTSIEDSTFGGCRGLTSIVIPAGVTSIGGYAFARCSGLTNVVIPSGVTSIAYSTFEGCSGLTSIVIPEAVTSIGYYAFAGCSGLTSIVIPAGVTSIGGWAFARCSGLTNVVIPSGVTSIAYSTFAGCSGLTSIVIPAGVTSIGDSAFADCSGLTRVVISEGSTYSGRNIFPVGVEVIRATGVTLTSHPKPLLVNPETKIVLNVTATGTAPISFQWLKNGEPIPGATRSELSIESVRKSDAGIYRVVVNNILGSVASAPAELHVQQPGVLSFETNKIEKVRPENGNLPLEVKVRRVRGSVGAVSAEVVLAGGNASASDHLFTPVKLEWAHGDAEDKIVAFDFKESAVVSTAGKTLVLRLQKPDGGALIGLPGTIQVTVRPVGVKQTLSFSAGTYSRVKSDSDTVVSIPVQRSSGTGGSVSARVVVAGGTAVAGQDYTFVPGELVWQEGETEKQVHLIIKSGAQIGRTGKTVVFKLENPSTGAVLGVVKTATVTLMASDTPSKVTIESPASGATLVDAAVTLRGMVSDVSGISRVMVSLNEGDPEEAVLMHSANSNSSEWTLSLVPEQGNNTVKVVAYDTHSTETPSATATRSFTFRYLRPQWAGSYDGLLMPQTNAAALAADFAEVPSLGAAFERSCGHGLVGLEISAAGGLSGRLSLGGTVCKFKGVLMRNGSVQFGTEELLEVSRFEGRTKMVLGMLSFRMDEIGGVPCVTGHLRSPGGEVTYARFTASKHVYSAARILPQGAARVPLGIYDRDAEKGSYTSVVKSRFDNQEHSTNGGLTQSRFPQGHGYGRLLVNASGVVTWTGRLADGTAASYGNRLSGPVENPVLPFYLPLYGNGGFLTGEVVFDGENAESDAFCLAMRWFRPAQSGSPLYGEGWPDGITAEFEAAKYLVPSAPTRRAPRPANSQTILGPGGEVAPPVSVALVLTGGGMEEQMGQGPRGAMVAGNINAKSVFSAAAGLSSGVEVSNARVVFNAATGILTGSFSHPGSAKPVAFGGAVMQKNAQARGYFLYQPKGEPHSSGAIHLRRLLVDP